ncbi:MAG: glycosyltransferase family 2 protein [Bacteroidales bacterium]|nr:glycosyltransferase family 2 protein [Bacteroidales bacterium]
MKLSIIIVNYNVKHYLWQCLDSVRRASKGLEMDVWVVDNASTDGSIPFLQKDFPEVHFIANNENVGFSKANNIAIRQSSGEYVLLLNPDTLVAEDCLHACVAFMQCHPRCGALGVHMINRDGSFALESRRGLPTPATSFYKVTGLCRHYPTHPRFGRYYMGHLAEYAEGRIEVISGAFMMLRREALNEVGLLDEDYFMYGEDIDLSYRIGVGGWECWYVPQLILHYKGESTQNTSLRYIHSFYNAMLIFFRKHFAKRYWFSWFLVEVGVLLMGMMSFVRNYGYLLFRRIREFFQKSTPPEILCFKGSDDAWTALQPICQRAGIEALRIASLDGIPAHAHYLTFEISGNKRPDYREMLEALSQSHQQGLKVHLGTFNLQNKTLILPNDIYC